MNSQTGSNWDFVGFDHDVPCGFDGAFPEGEYGVRVWTGPSLERLISGDLEASTLTIGRAGKAPSAATIASLAYASPASEAADRLMAQARTADVTRCARLKNADKAAPLALDGPALAAIRCQGRAPGVGRVMLSELPDPLALTAYWARWIEQVPRNPRSKGGVCWNGEQGVTTWLHGSVACFVSKSRNGSRIATVGWTDERTNTYGSVRGTDGNLKALFRWWRTGSP